MKEKRQYEILKDDLACPCCGKAEIDDAFLLKLNDLSILVKGLEISSGYRCPKYVAEKGFSQGSPHNKGIAADIKCTSARKKRRLVFFADCLGFKGIGVYDAHIHVDTDPRWHGEDVIWPGKSQ